MTLGTLTRGPWPLLALGAALYCVFLLLSAPAWVLAWAVAAASHRVAALEDADGALWRGHAAAIVVTAPGSAAQRIEDVTWRSSPWQLLRGQLPVHLTVNGESARGNGTLVVKVRSLELNNVSLSASTSAVTRSLPVLQLARPGGRIALRAGKLVVAKNSVEGTAEIDWIDASSALSAVAPLGAYRASVKGNGGNAEFVVTTLRGPLEIVGAGSWTTANGLRFSGRARAPIGQLAALLPLLDLLGPDDGSGGRQLRYTRP